jgi:hypothetical protein
MWMGRWWDRSESMFDRAIGVDPEWSRLPANDSVAKKDRHFST